MKIWIGRAESLEFVLIAQYNMLLMRDGNGKVSYEYHEADIEGLTFEMMCNIEGENQSVKFKKTVDSPSWATRFITDKANSDINFFEKHFAIIKQNAEGEMIGKRVNFWYENEKYDGVIKDKLCIPLASNPPRGYVPHDNYLIVNDDGKIFIVNPVNLNHIINEQNNNN